MADFDDFHKALRARDGRRFLQLLSSEARGGEPRAAKRARVTAETEIDRAAKAAFEAVAADTWSSWSATFEHLVAFLVYEREQERDTDARAFAGSLRVGARTHADSQGVFGYTRIRRESSGRSATRTHG